MVEIMVNKSKQRPNAAITGTGVLLGSGIKFFSINLNLPFINGLFTGFSIPEDGRKVDIVQGVSGVLYKRSFFPNKDDLYKEFISYAVSDKDLFKSDDIVISGYLSLKNIDRYTFNDMHQVRMGFARSDALSYDFLGMMDTFNKTISKCKKLGMFPKFEESSMTESTAFKIFLFISIIVIFIILFILCLKLNEL